MTTTTATSPVDDPSPTEPAAGALPWRVAAVLAFAALVVSRLVGLTRSLWWDEAFTAHRYVRGGAEVIFEPTQYVANNHVLYSLLASWTTDVLWLGDAVIRLWAVGPALAAAALVLWWAWRRLSPAVAVTATVLLTISPLAVQLQTEARGYGLVLLSATVLLVTTSRGATHPPRWGDDLAAAAAGAAGMLTFPPVVALYLAHAGVWFLRRRSGRLRLVVLTAASGLVTFLVLRPLLGVMVGRVDRVGSNHADPISWWSPFIGPAQVLGGPSFDPALPGGRGVAAGVTVVLLVAGLTALLVSRSTLAHRSPQAFDVGLQVAAALGGSIALLGLVNFSLLDRYVAFALPALLVTVAVGLVALVRVATGDRPPLTSAVVLVLLVAAGASSAGAVRAETAEPRQDFAGAVAAIAADDPATIVVRRLHVGYAWYLGRAGLEEVRTEDGDEATEAFCEGPRPAVYLPDPNSEPPDGPACLDQATRRSVAQRGGEMIWYELR